MGSRVICISASDGAGAEALAAAVGEALGFRVIDDEIVAHAAAHAGVDQQTVQSVEQRKTVLTKIMDSLALWGVADPQFMVPLEAYPDAGVPPNEELRGLIRSAIEEFVSAGDVVILAHGASQLLAGREHVLRVLITASPLTRSARLAASRQISAKEAESLVKGGDAGRADYLKRFYGIEHELPTLYDIVVNTDRLTPEQGAAAIVSLAGQPESAVPSA